MTILSLSNRLIEGFVEMPLIVGSRTKLEVKRNHDIQGTIDSIKELMDLKGQLKCNLKIVHTGDFTRYRFIKGEMNSEQFEEKLNEVCRELN